MCDYLRMFPKLVLRSPPRAGRKKHYLVGSLLTDYLSSRPTPDGLLYQLWYLDDGALIGSRSALVSFLDSLQHHSHGFGLCHNLSKCEVFWPSGDQKFSEFPFSVRQLIFSDSSGPAFLGSPVWGSSSYFASFVSAMVDKVSALQGHLQDLENPQVELHLRVLVSPRLTIFYVQFLPIPFCHSSMQLFDSNLCYCLSRVVMPLCLIELGAKLRTLPLSLGGLGLREASCVLPAAFLGSCVGSQGLCARLLALFHDSTVTFPSIPGRDSASTNLSSLLSGGPLPPVDHQSESQSIFQHSLDFHNFLIYVPYVIRLESGVFLFILVPVLDCWPFPLNHWASPCPARSL